MQECTQSLLVQISASGGVYMNGWFVVNIIIVIVVVAIAQMDVAIVVVIGNWTTT